MKSIKFASVLFCLLAGLGSAHASPKITGVSVSARQVTTEQTVTVTVRGEELENAVCALRVNYGDGSSVVRHMDWGKKVVFPVSFKKKYARPGTYAVRAYGVKSGNFLNCLGEARVTIKVAAPAVPPVTKK